MRALYVGMMEALTGKGGDGNGMDPKALEEMMASMGAGGGGALKEDLDNMSPEEIASMTKGALEAVKTSLETGSITKKEIAELEQMMGMDLKSLVGLMDQGKVDKEKLKKEFGSDFGDLLDIFKQLSKIKE
jgi:hypothetical protein